jgi:hypothetical protein
MNESSQQWRLSYNCAVIPFPCPVEGYKADFLSVTKASSSEPSEVSFSREAIIHGQRHLHSLCVYKQSNL